MKFKATCENMEMFVDISGIPELAFDEHEIATPDNSDFIILGAHKWAPVETNTDMTPFFGRYFQLESDEYIMSDCIVLKDRKSIFYRNAELKRVHVA